MLKQPTPVPLTEFAKAFPPHRSSAAPKVHRNVLHYPLAILDGCSTDAQKLVVRMLGEAIETGAPIYNEGKAAACYHVYDGTASDLERKLPSACKGPAKILADAQKKAAGLGDASAQAWSMRDAFDGLLDAIVRKQH
jgi:serine protease Do